MNILDSISDSLETIFWVKILKFVKADPVPGMEKIWIRDKHPGHWNTEEFSHNGIPLPEHFAIVPPDRMA
jgi:hypothetical protein